MAGEQPNNPRKVPTAQALAASAPWLPVPYEKADVYAIKALAAGTADAEQQKRALRWIIEQAAGTYDLHYRPDNARDTDFALGRGHVGQQIVKLIKINPAVLDPRADLSQ